MISTAVPIGSDKQPTDQRGDQAAFFRPTRLSGDALRNIRFAGKVSASSTDVFRKPFVVSAISLRPGSSPGRGLLQSRHLTDRLAAQSPLFPEIAVRFPKIRKPGQAPTQWRKVEDV
jgi:hypothetical protein